ncbi:L-lactate permease [Desulfurella multipotens]|uniref:L-lactate permease n=1 Tax=Desulfurella multipotens TaxID=79269 RepID=UPI000CC4230C|nr:L-lactate permease [Desulfurella multipotens]PMP63089.1 MAG: L-lactate permease [Desulfurella multipotens]
MDFFVAILPILLVLVGMLVFNRSGSFVSVFGWLLCFAIAVYYFNTPFSVVWGATIMGIVKALGISLAVTFTMFLIFLMNETKALSKIIDYIKGITKNKEEQTLFLGMGFGSLSTALGMVTPAMFPPIFRLLGFSPVAAIAISILCYDPLTSFALFSIPITLPAKVAMSFGIKPPGIDSLSSFVWEYTFKITAFLPFVSMLFAFLMLYTVGGMHALKKNWIAATLSGLVLSLTALFLAWSKIAPVEIIGVLSGLATMVFVYFYYKNGSNSTQRQTFFQKDLLVASSPFIILILLSFIVNMHSVKLYLSNLLNPYEIIHIFADKKEDLNILSSVWFWIMVVGILSIFILKPTKEQLNKVTKLWLKRIWGPFLAYSLFFSVAYIMAWSGMDVVGSKLVPSSNFTQNNMDIIISSSFAKSFGSFYPLVAPFLGLIGAFVGGSSTASNVLFAKIQWEATISTVGANAFMWIYAAHAVGGGIASAITPSKITNAAATIGVGGKEEAQFIKATVLPVLFMCLVVGILSMIFIYL